MKLSLTIFYFLVSLNGLSQKNEILYVPPLSVQDSIFFNVLINNPTEVGCVFEQVDDNEFVVIVFQFSGDTLLKSLVSSSSRYLKVKDIKLPLVFYSDFRYSTHFNYELDESSVKSFDNLILGGYMCKFTGKFKSGELLFSGWVW